MALYKDSVGNTYKSLPTRKASKGSKGAKPGPKHSTGRKKCERYRAEGIREKNKARRLEKRIRKLLKAREKRESA